MKHKLTIVFLMVLLLFGGITPHHAVAQSSSTEAQYHASLLQLIELLQAQITALTEELAQRQLVQPQTAVRPDSATRPNFPFASIAQYKVAPSATQLYIRNQNHQAFFNRVLDLTPIQYRPSLVEFIVYDGTPRTSDAYVSGQKYSTGYFEWYFGVSDELLSANISPALIDELIVHELGHIVALEEALDPGADNICHEAIGTPGNCPAPQSIYAQFIERFWSEELLDELENEGDDFEGTEVRGVENYFVSDYASISPDEDFAETFMVYVLGNGNAQYTTTMTRQKINWLDQFSTLQRVRATIRAAL